MKYILSIDFETWSEADIRKLGARAYAAHPSTRVLMMAYHWVGDSAKPKLWLAGMPVPPELLWVLNNGAYFSGWNINFERAVWAEKAIPINGFPVASPECWLDTMHLAAAANLPRSLDGASLSTGGPKKDKEGHTLMLQLTSGKRTKREQLFDGEQLCISPKLQEKWEKFKSYCVKDVEAEEGVALRVPAWPDVHPWVNMPAIDRRINDRGILVDIELVHGLAKAATIETARLNEELVRITDGEVPAISNVGALKTWLLKRGVKLPTIEEKAKEEASNPELQSGDEDDVDPTEREKEVRYRLRKSDLVDLLVEGKLDDVAYRAVDIRLEAAKASIKKLNKILASVGADGRIRDSLTLGGAQATMRWGSPGVQLHNTVRDCIGNKDEVALQNNIDDKKQKDILSKLCDISITTAINTGRTGDPDLINAVWTMTRKDNTGRTRIDGVLPFISRMTRRILSAEEGNIFLSGDFANIEARIPVWLSGQEDMVTAYREGKDVYRLTAAPIYSLRPDELTKQQRQVGKVVVLACIAEGELVLTDKGLVPIEKVTVDMKLWDGVEWVTHDGPIFQGYKEVITYAGLTATRDHKVYVEGEQEPLPFEHAAVNKLHLVGQNRQSTDVVQTSRPVWDILNAGPRHRFTVSGCLVSNCGFAGGVGAFVPMAMNYGLLISKDEAVPIVKKFRDSQPFLTRFWDANLEAAINAVCFQGSEFNVAPKHLNSWFMEKNSNCLCCKLPSGRLLRYWAPRLQKGYWQDGTEKSVPDLTVLFMKGNSPVRRTLWRGLCMENITQAIAADLLATALENMDNTGVLPVVLHVHDNAVAEINKKLTEDLLPLFNKCMVSMPKWADGLPIAVDTEITTRFG